MVKTAKEFYDEHYSDDTVVIMRDYAKLHVEAALNNIEIVASINCNNGKMFRDFIDENLILNAYPIENIK